MDASPHLPRQGRVPVFNMPGIVTASIGLLMAIHALREFVLPDAWDAWTIVHLALLPARATLALDPSKAEAVLAAAAAAADPGVTAVREAFARYIIAEPNLSPWTFASYGLLHGSWMHVILNVVWLAAFGSPVARRCGAWRYGAIALAGTVAGGLAHVLVDPLSTTPLVGASAGISALRAAACRFVFQRPVVGYGDRPWQLPPRQPLESLPELLRNRTAAAFLAIWLGTNLLFGLVALPLGADNAAIAWDAHLGGFLAGFLLFPYLDAPSLRRR